MGAFIDLVGQNFGRLTAISVSKKAKRGRNRTLWLCKCICGNEKTVTTESLRSGHTQSCGCMKRELLAVRSTKHGMSGSREHNAWREMKTRCRRKYIGRHIEVCERWSTSFEAFLSDMGICPPGLQLDREDNTKGYEPGNCRWATSKEQGRNTRRNIFVTALGKTQTVAAWAEELNKSPYTMYSRIRAGWSDVEVIA